MMNGGNFFEVHLSSSDGREVFCLRVSVINGYILVRGNISSREVTPNV